jgi:regulatory protein
MKNDWPRQVDPTLRDSHSAALECAVRILARRDHARTELALKLHRRGFGRAAVEAVLARCRELGYLDDAKTARILAAHMATRGYGPLWIRQALVQKGIDPGLIENALDCCGDEADRARRQLRKKGAALGRQADPWKRRQMAYRYLSGRGFSAAVIWQLLEEI